MLALNMQKKRKRRESRDWSGYEDNNWLVHRQVGRNDTTNRIVWEIQCKHCKSINVREIRTVQTATSCGCIRKAPSNKGKRVIEDIDKVNGYWLLRKPWKEGVKLETGGAR